MGLNRKLILKMSALILAIIGLGMIPPALCAVYYGERSSLAAFGICAAVYICAGFVIYKKTSLASRNIRIRDGYIVVVTCWLTACFFGAFPYYFSGSDLTFIQSLFESTAGITTTGATILTEATSANSALLFKAISHWLGGMGILVLIVSILPNLGSGGQTIANAETPTPRIEKVTNRISDTARILYIMYLSFSVIEFVLLLASSKISVFEALVTTLSTISTGGFLTHDIGIVYYNSIYIEAVITVFSILVAVNFNIYFYAVSGRLDEIRENTELKVFMVIILMSSLLITASLQVEGVYGSFLTSFRHALTQVVSFITTSGFTFANFMDWPAFAKTLLFLLMLVGGCAASTSGGLKIIRAIVFVKLIFRGFVKRLHPRSVVPVKLGNNSLEPKMVTQIATFILVYLFVFIGSMLIISLEAPDLESALGTSVSILSNTGIVYGTGIADLGFNYFSDLMKLFLSLLMIVGRLELFTVLILLSPGFWNPNRQKN